MPISAHEAPVKDKRGSAICVEDTRHTFLALTISDHENERIHLHLKENS